MAQVIIRNLDDDVVERLKRQAAVEKTSLEKKLRQVVTNAAGPDWERFDRIARRIKESTQGTRLDVVEQIREDRDR